MTWAGQESRERARNTHEDVLLGVLERGEPCRRLRAADVVVARRAVRAAVDEADRCRRAVHTESVLGLHAVARRDGNRLTRRVVRAVQHVRLEVVDQLLVLDGRVDLVNGAGVERLAQRAQPCTRRRPVVGARGRRRQVGRAVGRNLGRRGVLERGARRLGRVGIVEPGRVGVRGGGRSGVQAYVA